jgi:hypothetical protein
LLVLHNDAHSSSWNSRRKGSIRPFWTKHAPSRN